MFSIKLQIRLICIAVFSFYSVNACEPVFQSHHKYFRKAKAVFIGKILEINPNDSSNSEERKYFPYKIKFLVEKSWKGKEFEITVVSDANTSMCTPNIFKQGEEYLVYAFGKNLEVPTYFGNRTRLLKGLNNETQRKEFQDLDNFWFRLKSKFWLF